jgi:hypothetical protein
VGGGAACADDDVARQDEMETKGGRRLEGVKASVNTTGTGRSSGGGSKAPLDCRRRLVAHYAHESML